MGEKDKYKPKTNAKEQAKKTKEKPTNQDKLKSVLGYARKRVGFKPVYLEHITEEKVTDINDSRYSELRRNAAKEFMTNELKFNQEVIIVSTKLSKNSPILWVELNSAEDVDSILMHSSKVWNLQAKAIMYPPSEIFRTIKSIEANCKKAKEKDPDLRYNVKLGVDNL